MIRLAIFGTGTIEHSRAQAANIAELDQVFAAMYRAQARHFLDCFMGGNRPSPGAREGYVIMRIVDAACESSGSRQAVELEDES